ELSNRLPPEIRDSVECSDLAAWGCGTTMHVVRLLAPTLDSEDYLKDIDFSPGGILARWQAGLRDTRRMIERAPWNAPVDPMEGVIVHEVSARAGGDRPIARADGSPVPQEGSVRRQCTSPCASAHTPQREGRILEE
ncbi:MAG TPA: DUF3734 domain-containing protein, partial [Chthoniobacterales bacterium]|nr:DUF3734 domain-containing protein [Chthoniobacterales bacterium]